MRSTSAWSFYVSLVVFALTYAGIFLQRAHRTAIAIAGAVAMISLGAWFSFYDVEQAVAGVDFDTITLLFGMMIIVALFRETGFFQYLAIRAAKFARGKPWLLLIYFGLVTSIISMVLDNVTTILILVPVTISLADILGIAALPFLLAEVLLSNIGGVATLIGDPPNILIGSAAGFGFLDFLEHLLPIVVIVWICSQGLLLLLFRRELARPTTQMETLIRMDEQRAIVDPKTARRMLAVLGGTVLLFFVHELIRLDPGLIALIGASVGLLWIRPDFDRVMREIHWDVLLFFLSLFVIVGGLEAGGVADAVGVGLAALARHGIEFAMLAVLWVGALAAGVISNVPFTIAMLPVLKGLALQGVSVVPLWWALAIGVGFGANLTPLGSAANVVVISLAESSGEPLSFRRWLGSGTVIALVSCAVGSVAIILAHRLGLL